MRLQDSIHDTDPDSFFSRMWQAGATHAGTRGDAGYWERWAVWDLEHAAALADLDAGDLRDAWERRDRDLLGDVAGSLTGWHAAAGAPGAPFARSPGIYVSRHRVIVSQSGGLDI